MRYGFLLTGIAAANSLSEKKQHFLLIHLKDTVVPKRTKRILVSEEEGKFIRDYRKKEF